MSHHSSILHVPPMIGDSSAIKRVQLRIDKLGPADLPILISGETGSGKEIVARMLHARSTRAQNIFHPVNSAAVPTELFESGFFGHEQGAFTGAYKAHRGHLERAHGGTLFLDEIGDTTRAHQAKLLRALEQGIFERVGGTVPVPVNFRLISATNHDLQSAIENDNFRADLYYRIAGAEIYLPPLRDRDADCHLLAEYFIAQTRRKLKLSKEFKDMLESYAWPGNVRELRMAIMHAVELSDGKLLKPEHLPIRVLSSEKRASDNSNGNGPGHFPSMEEMERSHIRRALERTRWNQSAAARLLNINRSYLIRRIKRYKLNGQGRNAP